MGDNTGIEWTDATWNPLRGCTRVSEGCRNCYAEGVAARFSGVGQPYEGLAAFVGAKREPRWTGKVALAEHLLAEPLRWKKPRRIFVNSMSDLFHESVPDEWIDRIFAVMALCPQHTFQVLTKRPERMHAYLTAARAHPVGLAALEQTVSFLAANPRSDVGTGCILQGDIAHLKLWPLPNVWLGVSVEDQAAADERIPLLLDTPAVKRFISAEPLLGAINLTHMDVERNSPEGFYVIDALTGRNTDMGRPCRDVPRLDWVIVGGESGPKARPMHPDWVRSLRDQCAAAGVSFFFKQWGEWWAQECNPLEHQHFADRLKQAGFSKPSLSRPQRGCWAARGEWLPGSIAGGPGAWTMWKLGKKAAGAMLDGREHREFPA